MGTSNITPVGSSSGSVRSASLRHTTASGAVGQTSAASVWTKRTLNIEDDPSNILSLSSSQITLGAGTYRFSAEACAYNVAHNKLRLQNITDSTTTLLGNNSYAANTTNISIGARISGVFTIGSTKTFELQHWASVSTTGGFGVANAIASVDEVHCSVEITKIA